MVFGVRFKVRGKLVDTGSEKRDLHFWTTGITRLASVVFDNCGFDAGGDHFLFPEVYLNLRLRLELLQTCTLPTVDFWQALDFIPEAG
jgi:hypothetical protein